MSKIYISRHGDYSNPNNINPFRSDEVSLSPKGIEQIEQNAEFLKDKNIAAIFSSPVNRCKQSAEIYSKILKLPIKFTTDLIEVGSPYQGTNNDTYHDELAGSSLYANEQHLANKGEPADEIIERMKNIIRKALEEYKNKNILIVSHGDPIELLFAYETGLSLNYEKRLEEQLKYIPKGGLIEMNYEGNKFMNYKNLNF
ncbi:MAG: histidine phosphatase family protein [Candidatus Dojkabacteria bacterium]